MTFQYHGIKIETISPLHVGKDDIMEIVKVSNEWANDQIEKYGRDNPWVMKNVKYVYIPYEPDYLNPLLLLT